MKLKTDNTLTELYKNFRKEQPRLAAQVSKEQFKQILERHDQIQRDFILEDGSIKLPEKLGVLEIGKICSDKKNGVKVAVDYYQTRRLKKKILNFNTHSDGYMYKVRWNKSSTYLHDKGMWIFKTGRYLGRQLAQVIKNKQNDYSQFI